MLAGRNDPGFVHNGPLAGLVAICAGSDVMHPIGACGIFGARALGGLGGVAFGSQVAGTLLGIAVAVIGGGIVYGALRATLGLRLDPEEEFNGTDLSIHRIGAAAERETAW